MELKGCSTRVEVTYSPADAPARDLVQGQDFTVSVTYADKKTKFGTGNSVTIKGKGKNFKGSATASEQFEVTAYELQDEDIVSVKVYAGLAAKSVTAVVKDAAGNTLNKNQYDLAVIDGELTLPGTTKLAAETEYKVVVTPKSGISHLTGEAVATVTAGLDFSKAKYKLSDSLKKNGVAYTGEEIDLKNYGDDGYNFFDKDIQISYKVGKSTITLVEGEDFEVSGYQNNVKKGSMTVYCTGLKGYSGTMKFKVKISAKPMKKTED